MSTFPRFKKYVFVAFGLAVYLAFGGWLIWTARRGGAVKTVTVELTMTVPGGHATDPLYRAEIAKFEEANPGVSVKLIPVAGKNYYQKVMVMAAGGTAPDLMWMGQSFREFAEKDLFLDLDGRIRSEFNLANYKPELLEWYTRDGRLYSLPFGVDLSFLICNLKLFRDAGLPPPRDDWSYQEFLHAARALTRRDASGHVFCYGFNGGLEAGIFGAEVFRSDTGELICDSAEMLDYFQRNMELCHRYRVSPSPEEAQGIITDANTLFRQERVAIRPLYTMHMEQAFREFAGMDYMLVLQPKIKQQSQWASSQAFCISRHTRYPELAWRLFRQFQSEEFQWKMRLRSLPGRLDLLDRVLMEAGRPRNYRILRRAFEVMAPTPRVSHLQELMSVFNRFSGMVFAGRLSAAEAMKRCRREMERRMEAFRKIEGERGV